MEQSVINDYNRLVERIQNGEILPDKERRWLFAHPIESPRYQEPWILTDMIPLEPGRTYALMIQCLNAEEVHPIVPTLTIPFERGGSVKLAGVLGTQVDTRQMKQSTKLSFKMRSGITAAARCVSDSGLLMVSYQGWVQDHKPFPLWFETVRCDRFAMKKTVLSENTVQYSCRGADGTEDAFVFLLNWYPV